MTPAQKRAKALAEAQSAANAQGQNAKTLSLADRLLAKKADNELVFSFDPDVLLEIEGMGVDSEGKVILPGNTLQGQRGKVVILPVMIGEKAAKVVFHASQIRSLLQIIVDEGEIEGVSITEDFIEVRANKMVQRSNGESVPNGSLGVFSLTPLEAKNLAPVSTGVSAIMFED